VARRKKSSPADAVIDLVALLPWWAGVLLGVLSYLLLHRLAGQALVPSTGGLPTQAIWKGLATAGQYIVPILCFAGAGISAWRRRARTQLVADVAQTQATSALDGMSWREFEMLVGEGFRLQGYQVMKTGGGGPDGAGLLRSDTTERSGCPEPPQIQKWRGFPRFFR